jgi:hypothetical protein
VVQAPDAPPPTWQFIGAAGLTEPVLLENPTTIVQGDRVTHLLYDVSR